MKPRLLILGDSITLGATEVFREHIYSTAPRSYVHDLVSTLDSWDIQTDAALHRTTTTSARLLPGILEAHRPDILLLMVGGSDADIDWKRFVVSKGARVKANVPVHTYSANLMHIINECRANGVTPVLTDVPNCDLAGRTAWLAGKIGPVIEAAVEANGGGQAEVDRRCAEHNSAVEDIAASTGVPLARWAAAVAHLPLAERLGPDFVHPGAAAHPIIAATLARTLRASLGSARPSNAIIA